jgi:hypothetical protein
MSPLASASRMSRLGTPVLFLILTPVLLLPAGTAHGQPTATSLHELAVLVGSPVEVAVLGGTVLKGRLIEASETGLLLNTDGKEVQLAATRIERVSRWGRDSLWNGALIGFAMMAAVPLIWSASSGLASDEWGDAMAVSVLYGGIGAGIGAGIDALIQRKIMLFRATASEVAIVPTIARHRKGIALSLRF